MVHLLPSDRSPQVAEVLELLERPDQNVIVNLLGIALADRPSFFAELLPALQELRSHTGRPHWDTPCQLEFLGVFVSWWFKRCFSSPLRH
ncbi:hypothetical protein [Fischerella sp.]|uniref:hypothetical protein n=1 Tax=Fischerella sp. TaxID=1191 RepID=UPI0025C1A899|nr:hypothetical protein [Fischerella sp.]